MRPPPSGARFSPMRRRERSGSNSCAARSRALAGPPGARLAGRGRWADRRRCGERGEADRRATPRHDPRHGRAPRPAAERRWRRRRLGAPRACLCRVGDRDQARALPPMLGGRSPAVPTRSSASTISSRDSASRADGGESCGHHSNDAQAAASYSDRRGSCGARDCSCAGARGAAQFHCVLQFAERRRRQARRRRRAHPPGGIGEAGRSGAQRQSENSFRGDRRQE